MDKQENQLKDIKLYQEQKALSVENIPIGKKLSEEAFYAGLKVTAEHIEESVAD